MQLLKKFDLTTIIELIVLLSVSIKGVLSFIQWGMPRLKKIIKKTQQPDHIKNHLRSHYDEINKMKDSIDSLTTQVHNLILSDRDDIKAFITRQHHYFVYQKGWIDDYSLDCIQRRYSHYIEEGGNSFIEGLMREIRKLPKKHPSGEA